MADTLSTRDINTSESVGSLDSEDKILMSDGGAALKSVPRNTLAKDIVETYEESIMGGEKQSVKKAMDSLISRMESLEVSHVPEGAIETAVQEAIDGYLDDGTLVNMVIEDGSITRNKVNAAFEQTLQKADSAMQPSVYDPNGYGTSANPVDPYSYAASQTQQATNRIVNTNTYTVVDDAVTNTSATYTGIVSAISGALNRAERYSNALLADYSPFEIVFADERPETGADRTFYLIPNENGEGYHKWWYITRSDGQKTWDEFGSSSTLVVQSLPTTGDEDVDYILEDNGDYQYYKWINNSWKMIAGSNSEVVTVSYLIDFKGDGLPADNNISTDSSMVSKYYLDISKLWVYRATLPASSSTVTWNYLTALVPTPSETKDYFVMDTSNIYNHFRYNGTRFFMVGSDTFSKEELEEWITPLETQIATMSGNINTIDAKVDALGNMVSDITETSSGINVYYKDGSSKSVSTKDLTIKVEDLDALDQNRGVKVTYTDGSTKDIEISGGGGGGGTYSGAASITRVTDASVQCVYGDTCNIEYTFSATDSAGDVVGSGTATWYVNNVKKATSTAYQVITNTFDIGPYLNVGGNTIKLSISVDTGGESPTVTTKTWTVNAVNLYLTWDYDDTTINTADTITLRWTPYGDLSKTTHIIIDGVERTDLQNVTTRSGVQQYVTMSKLSHGSHMVQMYLTASVNSQTIQSATVSHDMMFIDTPSNVPVISCSVGTNTLTQYNTLSIPIAVYNPSSLTTTLVLAEGEEDPSFLVYRIVNPVVVNGRELPL